MNTCKNNLPRKCIFPGFLDQDRISYILYIMSSMPLLPDWRGDLRQFLSAISFILEIKSLKSGRCFIFVLNNQPDWMQSLCICFDSHCFLLYSTNQKALISRWILWW